MIKSKQSLSNAASLNHEAQSQFAMTLQIRDCTLMIIARPWLELLEISSFLTK